MGIIDGVLAESYVHGAGFPVWTYAMDQIPRPFAPYSGGTPPAIEILAWTNAISLAATLFGKKAALSVWALSPLPQFANSTKAGDRPSIKPGSECLVTLARWVPPGAHTDVAALVAAALGGDRAAGAQLEAAGVLVSPPGHAGFVGICTTMGEARSVWKSTPYAVSWTSALKSLPGANQTAQKLKVAGAPTRCGRTYAILIPADLVNAAAAKNDRGIEEESVPVAEDAADIAAGRWLANAFADRLGL